MPVVPSKKKVQLAKQCMQTLTSFEFSTHQPYQILMSIYKDGRNWENIQTPSKSKNKRCRLTEVSWSNASTLDKSSSKLPNLNKKICNLRTKCQLNRKKITEISQAALTSCKYSLAVSSYKLQLLRSMKQVGEIKKIQEEHKFELQKLLEMVQVIRRQKETIQESIQHAWEEIRKLEKKIEKRRENCKHLQEKKVNICYSLESQAKRNEFLLHKLRQYRDNFNSYGNISKLSKQLFIIFVLVKQKETIEAYRGKNLGNLNRIARKDRKNFESATNNENLFQISVCHQNGNKEFKKIPYSLFLVCSLYFQVKLSVIDYKQLNKLSYFSKEIQNLFEYTLFASMVVYYFQQKLSSYPIDAQVQVKKEQFLPGQTACQINLQQISKDIKLEQTENCIEITLYQSKGCQCGRKMEECLKQEFIFKLLSFCCKMKVKQVQQTERCCYVLAKMKPSNDTIERAKVKREEEGIVHPKQQSKHEYGEDQSFQK